MVRNELVALRIGIGGIEAKREAILHSAKIFADRAAEAGYDYAPVCRLYESINVIMGWTDTDRCKKTVANMESKGIITISKSRKGFKLNEK